MRGFVEIKEDSYEDTIEHLQRIKLIACKAIKKMSEHSELYNDEDDLEGEEEYKDWNKKKRSRYEY